MRRVVFLVQPQVYLLDLAGPAQVFSTAADMPTSGVGRVPIRLCTTGAESKCMTW